MTIRVLVKKALPELVIYNYKQIRKLRKRKKLGKIYSGNEVVCLLCNHSFRIFETFKNQENEKCIHCISMKRHRLLYKFLIENTDLFHNQNEVKKVLHFAPEKAFFDIFSKNKKINYYPADLNPDGYKFYRKTKIYQTDITNIPFENNIFDVILCNHVLEHIIDDRKAMGELYRVMKNGGWGIFQVPIDFEREMTYEDFSKTTPEERYVAFGQYDHVRWYGKDFPQRLREAGFIVEEIPYSDRFSASEKFKYGFPEKEVIFLCRK